MKSHGGADAVAVAAAIDLAARLSNKSWSDAEARDPQPGNGSVPAASERALANRGVA